jgi:hypothetical protein
MIELIAVLIFAFIFYGSVILYHKFGLFKTFYHDVLGWHEPTDEREFDGCSLHSRCKHCGREIMQDSQGNWF